MRTLVAAISTSLVLAVSPPGAHRHQQESSETAGAKRTIDLAVGGSAAAIFGAPDKDQLGNDLKTGDLNGDGLADLAVGAHWGSPTGRNIVGRSYVLFGRAVWPATLDLAVRGSRDWSFTGPGRESRLGVSVATGDLSGDGTDDLILGSLLADPPHPSEPGRELTNAGVVYAMFGGPEVGGPVDFLDSTGDARFVGGSDQHGSDQLGTALTLGDFNGDGHQDLAAAAILREGFTGAVFVWWGPVAKKGVHHLQLDAADWTLLGAAQRSYFGSGLATGDLNDDGIDDLAVTAFSGGPSAPDGSGVVYVFYGGPGVGGTIDLATDSASATVFGESGSMLGGALSTGACSCRGQVLALEDMTGDGITDVVVGAPLENTRLGGVYIIPGPLGPGAASLPVQSHWHLRGVQPEGRLGWSVATGHLDGDGNMDLVAAAPWAAAAGREQGGVAYGFRGPFPHQGELALDEGIAPLLVNGPQPHSGSGGMSIALADTDGDGLEDLHLGFPDAAPLNRRSVGTVYIVAGPLLDTLATPTPTATTTRTSTATSPPTSTATHTPSATPTPTPSPTASWTATATRPPTSTPRPPGTRIFLPLVSRMH